MVTKKSNSGEGLNIGSLVSLADEEYYAKQDMWRPYIEDWVVNGAPEWFKEEGRKCQDCGKFLEEDRGSKATFCTSCAKKRMKDSDLRRKHRNRIQKLQQKEKV